MKIFTFRQLAACGAVMLLAHSTIAQTWQTVDEFPYGTDNSGLAVAPSGIVFAAGTGSTDTGYRGLIRASTDGGNTWSLLDDFLYPGLNYTINSGIVSD